MLYQALKLFHDTSNVYCNGPSTSTAQDNDYTMDGGFDNEAAWFDDLQDIVTVKDDETVKDNVNLMAGPELIHSPDTFLNNIDIPVLDNSKTSRNSSVQAHIIDGPTYYNIPTSNAVTNDEKSTAQSIYSNNKVFISSL